MTEDHQFNLACACKLGRLLGGHDALSTVRDMSPLPVVGAPVTMEQIRYAATLDAIRKAGNKEKAAERLQISKNTLFDIILRRQGRKVTINSSKVIQLAKVAALFLLCALGASVANAQPRGSALLLPSKLVSAVRTNTSRTLVWDSLEPQFNVYRGAKRSSLVKVATVSSNGYPYTNGAVYAVSSVNFAGVESSLAYYPSNRVGALQWETSTNLSTWITGGTLETFTNTPARPRMYLRVVDRTTGWLPPD
jgi:hypothetical protein